MNNLLVEEKVFAGPTFDLAGTQSEIALILWTSNSAPRPLLSEFSFRYKSKKESFSPACSAAAKSVFELIQRLDWARPDALTKTEFVYRSYCRS